MERNVYQKLIEWKKSKRRKPLILEGARQVGKTWLMEEFAKNEYTDFVILNFKGNKEAKSLFIDTVDPKAIIERISIMRNKPIKPHETLIIFDEIQDCPDAVSSLKFFNEQANEFHLITAGSLLGTYLAKETSFPVGKVNIIYVYPLSFDEFLREEDDGMYKYYSGVKSKKDFIEAFHNRMMDLYRKYLIVGGMPECVASWLGYQDTGIILQIQEELIKIYENDISQHNAKIPAAKTVLTFRNIIPQLAKENEKFIYSAIRQGGRGRDFEDAIEWLVTSGLVLKANNLSAPTYPIKAYEKFDVFKLFMLDCGLAKYKAGIDNKSILLNEDFMFKGKLNENYVAQQITTQITSTLNYFSPSNDLEVDFIVQSGDKIVPIEVKSGKGKKANSLKRYIDIYKPEKAIRISSNGYVVDGNITNIPLYFASKVIELIETDKV